MKKAIKTFLTALMVFAVAASSYAMDNGTEPTLMARLMPDDERAVSESIAQKREETLRRTSLKDAGFGIEAIRKEASLDDERMNVRARPYVTSSMVPPPPCVQEKGRSFPREDSCPLQVSGVRF